MITFIYIMFHAQYKPSHPSECFQNKTTSAATFKIVSQLVCSMAQWINRLVEPQRSPFVKYFVIYKAYTYL